MKVGGYGCGVHLVCRVHALGCLAPVRSSAARAAHRDARPLPHLFRANYSCDMGARPLGAHLNIETGQQGGRAHWYRYDWPETDVGAALRRDAPRGRRSVSQALHTPRQAPRGQHATWANAPPACGYKHQPAAPAPDRQCPAPPPAPGATPARGRQSPAPPQGHG